LHQFNHTDNFNYNTRHGVLQWAELRHNYSNQRTADAFLPGKPGNIRTQPRFLFFNPSVVFGFFAILRFAKTAFLESILRISFWQPIASMVTTQRWP
jgi:hypothetical protein